MTISIIEFCRSLLHQNVALLVLAVGFFSYAIVCLSFIFILKDNHEISITGFLLLAEIVSLPVLYRGDTGYFDNTENAFYLGHCMSLIETTIVQRIPKLSYRTVYRLTTAFARFLAIPAPNKGLYIIQIVNIFVSIYLDYNEENKNKRLFGSYFYSKEQLNKFKDLMVNDIPDGIVILSRDLRKCLFANNSFQNLLDKNVNFYCPRDLETFEKYSPQQTERNSLDTAADMDLPPTLLSSLQDFLKKNTKNPLAPEQKLTLNLVHRISSQNFFFDVKAFQLLWDQEPAVVIIFHDITQQNTILELKIAANLHKDRVLATVSHELRTPLNSILGLISVMQETATDPSFTENLAICKNSCNLLQGLINSILDLNLIRANKIKLYPEKINIQEFLNDVARLFEFQCTQKGLYLKQNISCNVPNWIITDKARLSQILINLIGNALKFTSKGGITISAEQLINNQEEYIQISIEDTGIGIKEEDKGKLFKMFGKIEQSNTIVNRHGVGLGLNISENLSKLLCDNDKLESIHMNSTYGKGTTFSFFIKKHLGGRASLTGSTANIELASEEGGGNIARKLKRYTTHSIKPVHFNFFSSQTQASFENLSQDALRGSKSAIFHHPLVPSSSPTVLIVDDNPLNLFVAQKLVLNQDLKVKTALSGQIAIDLLLNHDHKTQPIALVLMDLQMPVMDGYMTTKSLKNLMQCKKIPEIPIVALTANDSEIDKAMCRKVGMGHHLSKPLKVKELCNILNSYSVI